MAKYNQNSINALASIIIGISDIITFLFAVAPIGLFAIYIYDVASFSGMEEFFEVFKEAFKEAWIVLVPSTAISAGIGYLITLIFRVFGQLLLCAVQIEENTRKEKTT